MKKNSCSVVAILALLCMVLVGCPTPTTPELPESTETPDQTVAVTGVTVSGKSSIYVDDSTTLTATIVPANATNKAVTWTSSNEAVATVSNGVVTGVTAGSATITVNHD